MGLKRALQRWLDAPQDTNRQALKAALLAGLIVLVLGYAARVVLDLADVVSFRGSIPIWIAALAVALTVAVGWVLGRRSIDEAADEAYFEHVRDALADLRRHFAAELPDFSVRDFVESGVFHPAERLLTRRRDIGEVRFSVLHPDETGEFFVMAEDALFPALGHSAEARENFVLPIADSFSELAYHFGRVQWSNRLSEDNRFRPHPQARPGREYESIVSVPLWRNGAVDGVFNVIATAANAFSSIDRIYITLLGSVIDVARVPD